MAVAETHIGPLPHPQTFAAYESILPGSAREILEMAKAEQKHRHDMERLESRYPYFGLSTGAAALLACVTGSVYLGWHGERVVAIALVGAPVLAAIGWLVNGRPAGKADPSSVGTTADPVRTPKEPVH